MYNNDIIPYTCGAGVLDGAFEGAAQPGVSVTEVGDLQGGEGEGLPVDLVAQPGRPAAGTGQDKRLVKQEGMQFL